MESCDEPPTKKRRKSYTAAFKLANIKRIEEGGISKRELCRDLEISRKMLRMWIKNKAALENAKSLSRQLHGGR